MEKKIALATAQGDFEFLAKQSPEVLKKTNYSIPPFFVSDLKEDVTLISHTDLSLIHIASYCDCLECYQLLENKAQLDFTTKSSFSQTCINFCCAGGAVEVLSYIFAECQKDPQKNAKLQTIFTADYNASNNFLSLATLATSDEILNLLFANGYGILPDGTDKRNDLVTKAIGISIKRKSVKCLKTLLQYKRASHRELSPLQIAISAHLTDAIPLLLDSEIRLDYMNPSYDTALSIACLFDNVTAVKLICDKMIDIDIPITAKAPSAVHWMCRSGNPDIMRIMLQHQPDLNRIDQNGKPAITYMTVTRPDENIIKMLEMLQKAGYNMNDPKYPAIGYFLTAVIFKPKVVEWFLQQNVNLNYYIKRNNGQRETIRQYILNNRQKADFSRWIEKYHIDQ